MNIFSRFQEDAFAFCIDCHTLLGVAGIDMSLTPISERASTIALITAGGDPIAPTSPTPLTPKVLCVHNVD
jgi:hypothetical protein